jgi:DnaJ-class molecular chaperone
MAADDTLDPAECRACRGGGKVISNLGGEPSEVDCPWCEGSGRFIPEHDAQAHWKQGGDSPPAD